MTELSALRILRPEAVERLAALRLDQAPFVELADPFTDELLADLELELPAPGSSASLMRLRELGYGFRRLDDLFGCPDLIELLGRLSGERSLVHDFDYELAGLRSVEDSSPQRLSLGLHPRGWRRRLTVIACLDPGWTGAGAAALPASRSRLLILPSDDWFSEFVLQPPEGGAPCRYVIVHFYGQGEAPRRKRRAQAKGAVEPASLLDELRLSAADGILVHGLVTAELTRQAFALQSHSRELFQKLERYRDALWPSCCDGTQAIGDEELRTFVSLPNAWNAALAALEEGDRVWHAVLQSAGGLPALPLSGDAIVERQQGCWRDGWVGPQLTLRVLPRKPIRAIVVEGAVPTALSGSQRLFASISECLHQLLPPIGEFRWRFAVTDAPSEPITLRVTAAQSWCPAREGDSPDSRPLAWHLRRLTIET